MITAMIVTGLAQAQAMPTLVREGNSWVQTTVGTFPCAVRGQLKMTATSGNVSVRGVSRDDCGFKVRQRTRAANESEARYRLRGVATRSRSMVETSFFNVQPVEGSVAFLDIELQVPRTMREANVGTRSGDVQVADVEGAVSIETGAGALDVDRVGGNLVARTAGGPLRIGRVGGSVNCYSGGGFIRIQHAGGITNCDTVGGEISVDEAIGPLYLTSGGGNIEVLRAASHVTAKSLSGIIEIEEAGGLVTAVARGGSIQIGTARGGARCEANGGAIRVKTQDGPLRLNTMMGNILAQLVAGRLFADSVVNSEAGDVTMTIPAEFPVRILAVNETPGFRGRIVSDFPEIRVMPGSPMQPVKAEGSLNGGGPVLQVSTASGSIFLRKQR